MNKKIRLDQLLVERGIANGLEQAQRLILAGLVRKKDEVFDKPGMKVSVDVSLEVIKNPFPYVSMGAIKLERALEAFEISAKGFRCLDVGASTGGFTEVLLNRGACHVTALDVGYGQLDWKLRADSRVNCIERTNFRLLPDDFFSTPFDFIVVDVSFISLMLILPKAMKMLTSEGNMIALIKPQFEAERKQIERGGMVKDPLIHIEVIQKLREGLKTLGLFLHNLVPVPRVDFKKNIEFVSLWRGAFRDFSNEEISSIVSLAHEAGKCGKMLT
ncbi:TlyA family RNA methyltransferase [bacterium]|nr:TlyA family RNA methyltransferase [bacterium]